MSSASNAAMRSSSALACASSALAFARMRSRFAVFYKRRRRLKERAGGAGNITMVGEFTPDERWQNHMKEPKQGGRNKVPKYRGSTHAEPPFQRAWRCFRRQAALRRCSRSECVRRSGLSPNSWNTRGHFPRVRPLEMSMIAHPCAIADPRSANVLSMHRRYGRTA